MSAARPAFRAPRGRWSSSSALAAVLALGVSAGGAAWADPASGPAPAAPSSGEVVATSASDANVAVKADATTPSDYTVDAVNKRVGNDPISRFLQYYAVEWGKSGPPTDPNAPPSVRKDWPTVPQTAPPMPFTDWPYGGTTLIGDNRTASVDSPLMFALAPTPVGKFLSDTGIQAYGWVDGGFNVSTSHLPAGNMPAAYDYNPNAVQLDQAVLYVERTPDTVQTDHIDWGFRASVIYGTDYHYTTSYGLVSNQLLKKNSLYGYDFPMMYAELYVPKIADGLILRLGRYISLPDIEAQLAPNNYMYTHSITYTYDNYTNTGLQATLAVTKNIILQAGVSVGSDTALWNLGKTRVNPFPNPLFPNSTMKVDPGAKPSFTGCARFQSNSGNDDIYFCADAMNSGTWGYNNLQWLGFTYYHKFSDKFHVSLESYNLHQNNVLNLNNPAALNILESGGTPFSPQYIPFNAPNGAQCKNPNVLSCTASAQSFLTYWNYTPSPLANFSLRLEYYDDEEGQRTGVRATYYDVGVGMQYWLSPQIEFRPEYTHYWASQPAFNGDVYAGIAPNKKEEGVLSGDVIIHF